MKHVGGALFWFLIGVLCTIRVQIPGTEHVIEIPSCPDPAPVSVCGDTHVTLPSAEVPHHGHKPPRTRQEPKRGMTAGELTAWWAAWDKCKGSTCID